MTVTIKQIAEEVGVSIATVSNVINNKTNKVSADKIKVINDVIKKYNYVPNMNARGLVQSSSRLVGVLYYSDNNNFHFSDPFVAEFLEGVSRVAKELSFFTLIHNVTSVNDVETLQSNWNFDCFIAVGMSESFYKKIKNKVIKPIVFIDTYVSEINRKNKIEHVFINSEDFKVGYDAAKYCIDKGHKSIAFLSYSFDFEGNGVIQQRLKGFKKAMVESGIEVKYDDLFTDDQFEELSVNLSQYTCIVSTADYLAIEAISYLKKKKLFDSEKLSIIGIDDITFAKFHEPALTTIRLNQVHKGIVAGETVSKILSKTADCQIEKQIYLPGELIQRDSVKHKK
ncbi:LacI family DNA-binding transcriptional regulator [Lacticigenium naphthae]|uniref:LacI family DNA-binding transcriptional regulator n=1 Tax=Lacticigenium naphthae TaxID=515351 RepID=UPI00041A6975|nr:LacI family DNA-binding transcriptional regulator [Lacticigenium naphthae]